MEQWWEKALLGIDQALKVRTGDPLQTELDATMPHIGGLLMENELMRRERDPRRLFGPKRSLLASNPSTDLAGRLTRR